MYKNIVLFSWDHFEMPSNKNPAKKKTALYTEDSLIEALTEIRTKKVSVREASRKYQIPKSTLLDRIHGKTSDGKKRRGPDPLLGIEGEKRVVQWLNILSKNGFPVRKKELLDSVQSCIKNETTRNKFKCDRPGQTWYSSFLKRNPEVSRLLSEGTSRAKKAQVTEDSIRLWFEGLEAYLEEINQTDILNRPESIFNGDEISFSLCPITGQVLGPKDFRDPHQVTQGNEKDTLTVLVIFNVNGAVCPPCVVFPYVRPPREVVESMPPDWCLGNSESGWMRDDVFFEYISNDFINWLERSYIHKPVLLLVDGHKTHVSLKLSTMCEQMEIILYPLPPHTSHVLRPADISIFAPFKANWENTVRTFLEKPENTNSSVTKTNFCRLFAETLRDTNVRSSILNGYKRCGLYPFDPNAPDYTNFDLDTFVNTNTRQTSSAQEISKADVVIAKRVLKEIKPALLSKNVNYKVVIEELDALKKTLPEERNLSEFIVDTDSDCANSTMEHVPADISPMS